jgi:hypothetical protein
VRTFDHDFSALEDTLWTADIEDGANASPPVLGDLDSDGYDEIVVAFNRDGKDVVVALDKDGNVVEGHWPVDIVKMGGLYGRLQSPQVADIAGSDSLEVLIADSEAQQMHILNADGAETIGPWELGHLRQYLLNELRGSETTATVIDADGDGKPEVLHGTNLHQVAAWDPETSELESGWPIYSRESVRGQIHVADIDGQGGMEVIVADMGGWIHIWEYDEVAGFRGPKPRDVRTTSPVVNWLGLS